MSSGAFGDDATSTVIRSVRCCGNESELLDCSLSTSDPGTCTEHSAAVICQGESSATLILMLNMLFVYVITV